MSKASLAALIDALDEPLKPEPRFPIEAPDRSGASEIQRQATFRKLMARMAPSVVVYANTNGTHIASLAGRQKANREGRTIGCPDLTVFWNRGVAWIEFKAGKGTLSDAQVEFGNRLVEAGHHMACFRSPDAAVEWIRSIAPAVFADRVGRL